MKYRVVCSCGWSRSQVVHFRAAYRMGFEHKQRYNEAYHKVEVRPEDSTPGAAVSQ